MHKILRFLLIVNCLFSMVGINAMEENQTGKEKNKRKRSSEISDLEVVEVFQKHKKTAKKLMKKWQDVYSCIDGAIKNNEILLDDTIKDLNVSLADLCSGDPLQDRLAMMVSGLNELSERLREKEDSKNSEELSNINTIRKLRGACLYYFCASLMKYRKYDLSITSQKLRDLIIITQEYIKKLYEDPTLSLFNRDYRTRIGWLTKWSGLIPDEKSQSEKNDQRESMQSNSLDLTKVMIDPQFYRGNAGFTYPITIPGHRELGNGEKQNKMNVGFLLNHENRES